MKITFVDIAHDIPAQDVRAGAFALLSSARHFPPGTIHIGVVDPGVGTERLGLVVEGGGQVFVGPDNGLLLRTYAQTRRIEPLITLGSHGFAEIAVNGGDLSCLELSLFPMNRS